MSLPVPPISDHEVVYYKVTVTSVGMTASVTVRDLATDELLGMAVRELAPFDSIHEVWADLYQRCPRQLPML